MPNVQSEISRLDQAQALGLEYLRTTILLNGGAIFALLTFIGNATASAVIQFNLGNLKGSMWAFLVGIVSVLLGVIISYSYTATAPESYYSQFWNRHIVLLNTLLALISLSAFILGVASLILGATDTPK